MNNGSESFDIVSLKAETKEAGQSFFLAAIATFGNANAEQPDEK
jgi:hypothetical protein